jgi:hypothetical protein
LLKLILIGVWMGVTTMSAIYVSTKISAQASESPVPAQSEFVEDFKTEHIAVAIFLAGKVSGYFTVRVECKISVNVNKERLKWVLANDLHRAVYANNDIKYEQITGHDAIAITKTLEQFLDKRPDDLRVAEVRLSEAQFLSRL